MRFFMPETFQSLKYVTHAQQKLMWSQNTRKLQILVAHCQFEFQSVITTRTASKCHKNGFTNIMLNSDKPYEKHDEHVTVRTIDSTSIVTPTSGFRPILH